jgi:hypothetical protein
MNHNYELQRINPEGSTFRILKYFDICLKVSFQTEQPINRVAGVSLKDGYCIPSIPFKQVGQCDYLIDEMFDLSNCLIITNTIVRSVTTLGIFVLPTPQLDLQYQQMSQSDLYRLIGVSEPIIPLTNISHFTKVVAYPGPLPRVKFAAVRYKKDQKVTFLINGVLNCINNIVHPFLCQPDGEYMIYSLSPGYTENEKDTFRYNAERLDIILESDGPIELLC